MISAFGLKWPGNATGWPAGASGSLGAALAHARRFGAKKVNAGARAQGTSIPHRCSNEASPFGRNITRPMSRAPYSSWKYCGVEIPTAL